MLERTKLEQKTDSLLFCVVANALLAVLIYFTANLGYLTGLQGAPLPVSVVWPVTGISLAALLLFDIKLAPGILLGNLAYNFSNFIVPNQDLFVPLVLAVIISGASLAEALVGNAIIRHYSPFGYFRRAKDVLIFLIPAGLLACMIAPTVGVLTLYLYEGFSWDTALLMWVTFWVGDTLGVYILTPLIVVWTLFRPTDRFGRYSAECFLMALVFLGVAALTMIKHYFLLHLFIPIGLWAAYRFKFHGATLVVFFVAIAIVVPTIDFYGNVNPFNNYTPLLVVASFLEAFVIVTLILAGVVTEREAAWNIVQYHNIDLQKAVEKGIKELKVMSKEISLQEKIATLNLLTSGIARYIQRPHKQIKASIRICEESLRSLEDAFGVIHEQFSTDVASSIKTHVDGIREYLQKATKFEMHALQIAKVMEEYALLTIPGGIKSRTIKINAFITYCLNKAMNEGVKHDPDFSFAVIEEFDKSAQMILKDPDDLEFAFCLLFNNSIELMKKNKANLGESYKPLLKVRTADLKDTINVVIEDNGCGIANQNSLRYQMAMTPKTPKAKFTFPNSCSNGLAGQFK